MIIINVSYSDWHLINFIINGTSEARSNKTNDNNYYCQLPKVYAGYTTLAWIGVSTIHYVQPRNVY